MRCLCFIFLSFISFTTLIAQDSPDERFGALFRQVQLAPVFEDSKTFPDCTPRQPVDSILRAYAAQKDRTNFDPEAFVRTHFTLPKNPASGFRTDTTNSIEEHIAALWPVLSRQAVDSTGERTAAQRTAAQRDAAQRDAAQQTVGSLIPLPEPYVVPGGRFREVYYWDSYFTMLGLAEDGRVDMIEHMVRNFAYLIDRLGFIPNGNRTYYNSRSQPPFFSLMVRLLADQRGAAQRGAAQRGAAQPGDSILTQFLAPLEREYAFWMDGQDQLSEENPAHRRVVRVDSMVMNRYWDDRPVPRPEAYKEDVAVVQSVPDVNPETLYRHLRAACESGWDFSSRWFADAENLNTIRTTDLIPVDLNALLYHLEVTLADAYRANGQTEQQTRMNERARARQRALRSYCWNATENFYFDYNFREQRTTDQHTLAAVYPLFVELARPREAKGVATALRRQFLAPGGLRTTLRRAGQQWDAPNGWAPLQYLAVEGLRHYQHTALADTISQRWQANVRRVYRNTGKLVEKYNVEDLALEAGGGEYPVQDGFGWTNGVFLKLNDEAKGRAGQPNE